MSSSVSAAAAAPVSSSSLSSWWRYVREEIGLINTLLVFVPIAIVYRAAGWSPTWQFSTAALAIVPLAGILGDATEHLSEKLGPGIGGLLNATFGNAAELIIALFSVFRGLDVLVKSSLVGSIIGNLLLVLGASILLGGMVFQTQKFSVHAAVVDSNMAVVSAIGFLVPSMFHHFGAGNNVAHEHGLSFGISVLFLVGYSLMLFFQLKTHSYFFDGDNDSAPDSGLTQAAGAATPTPPRSRPISRYPTLSQVAGGGGGGGGTPRQDWSEPPSTRVSLRSAAQRATGYHSVDSNGPDSGAAAGADLESRGSSVAPRDAKRHSVTAANGGVHVVGDMVQLGAMDGGGGGGGEHDGAEWSIRKSFTVMAVCTVFVVVLSEILTGAVEVAGEALGLGEMFMGVIIVAIVGNAAEHSTAVLSAMKNNMDIAISISFGSALQISMFVMPVVVLCSYLRDARYGPMDLTLSEFEVFAVSCSTLIAWMVVQDGGSHWLEGFMLLVTYAILGLAFFFTG